MTETIVPQNTALDNRGVIGNIFTLPVGAFLLIGDAVNITNITESPAFPDDAKSYLMTQREPYSPEPRARWLIQVYGELRNVEIRQHPAHGDLPASLSARTTANESSYAISPDQVFGRITGEFAASAAPAAPPPTVEWLTLDQAIDRLHIREWIALELFGCKDSEGWRAGNEAIDGLRYTLKQNSAYKEYIIGDTDDITTPFYSHLTPSVTDAAEFEGTPLLGSDCIAYYEIEHEGNDIIQHEKLLIIKNPTAGMYVMGPRTGEGEGVDIPLTCAEIIFPGHTVIGEVMAFHTSAEESRE